jgi:hypothetical protein
VAVVVAAGVARAAVAAVPAVDLAAGIADRGDGPD